jgi:hypothetical protein
VAGVGVVVVGLFDGLLGFLFAQARCQYADEAGFFDDFFDALGGFDTVHACLIGVKRQQPSNHNRFLSIGSAC